MLTSDGQRLEGQLSIPAGIVQIDQISYRRDKEQQAVTYTPEQVQGFGTERRSFVARRVNYNSSPRILRKMQEGRVYDDRVSVVFLEQFYGGAVDLYRYVDAESLEHYYIGSEGGQPEYLRYERQLTSSGEGTTQNLVGYDTYPQQLLLRFADCPRATEVVADVTYDLASLLTTVDQYLGCIGVTQAPVSQAEVGRFSVGLTAGVSQVIVNSPAKYTALYSEGSSSAGLTPKVGVTLAYKFPYRKLGVRLRTTYERFSLSEVQPFYPRKPNQDDYPSELIQQTLFNNLALTTQLGSGRQPIYLEVGAIFGLILQNERRGYKLFFTQEPEYEVVKFERGSDYGVSLGLGTQVGPVRIMAEGSYVDRSTEILYSTQRIGVVATYLLPLRRG